MSGKQTVLFSKKADWHNGILHHLDDKYAPFFYEFDEVDPDRFDLVLPLTLKAEQQLNQRPDLKIHAKGVVPSNEVIALCHDKLAFNLFLCDHGCGKYVPEIGEKLAYPYIVKKRIGMWGVGIAVIRNEADERAHRKAIASDTCFKQVYIEGKEEYSAHAIVKHGRVVLFKVMKFTFEERFFVKGKKGKHMHAEEVDHSRYRDDFEKVLLTLGYRGLCASNYKVVDGQVRIFEVNPRYGAYTHRFINDVLKHYG